MRSFLFASLLTWSALLLAADLSEPLILVAKPELRDAQYAATILVVRPVGGGQHIGFIVNRPTDVTLGTLFPQHGPSQKVAEPVYRGGPFDAQAIFALVRRPDSPGGKSLEIVPGLYAAFDEPTVDRIIESEADRARFVAGLVAWRPGELAYEVEQGAWYLLEADAALAMRSPEGLWEELSRRSRIPRTAI